MQLLGTPEYDDTTAQARAVVGALFVPEILGELKAIRRLLTPPQK